MLFNETVKDRISFNALSDISYKSLGIF